MSGFNFVVNCFLTLDFFSLKLSYYSDPSVAICGMQAGLMVIIQLCQRNSAKLDEPDREVYINLGYMLLA